uniref:Uncharacterized protein n=1 Tax=Glossina palpalis gambiensis TaxID=67801 RepID=A0A1B0B8F4_9MUSC
MERPDSIPSGVEQILKNSSAPTRFYPPSREFRTGKPLKDCPHVDSFFAFIIRTRWDNFSEYATIPEVLAVLYFLWLTTVSIGGVVLNNKILNVEKKAVEVSKGFSIALSVTRVKGIGQMS